MLVKSMAGHQPSTMIWRPLQVQSPMQRLYRVQPWSRRLQQFPNLGTASGRSPCSCHSPSYRHHSGGSPPSDNPRQGRPELAVCMTMALMQRHCRPLSIQSLCLSTARRRPALQIHRRCLHQKAHRPSAAKNGRSWRGLWAACTAVCCSTAPPLWPQSLSYCCGCYPCRQGAKRPVDHRHCLEIQPRLPSSPAAPS